MNRKAFFFDIDGTLLSEVNGTVPESTLWAVTELKKRGHLTFVNTGRTISSVPKEIKEMPFCGFICGCGTYVSYDGDILLSEHIPPERAKEIIRQMNECRAEFILEGVEECFYPEYPSRFIRLEEVRRDFRKRGLSTNVYNERDAFEYDKFSLYVDETSDMERIRSCLEKDMEMIDRGDSFYEIVPKKYSKATGIAFVLDCFHVKKEDSYVFGDSSNDLPMFQAVEHAIAMGAHAGVLEPYAEYVTKTVEEDGILHALKTYEIL